MHMITSSSLLLPLNKIAIIITAMLMAFWLSACSVTPPSTPAPADHTTTDANKDIQVVVDSKVVESAHIVAINSSTHYDDDDYPTAEYVQACAAKGGEYSRQGMSQFYMCVIRYDDAGKTCKGSADCRGVCESTDGLSDFGATNQTGQCSSNSSPFGCRQIIENGVAGNAMCID